MAPRLTDLDTLRLQWHVTLPNLLGGSVAPTQRFWPWLVRHQATDASMEFLRGVRKKYGPRAWSWFPAGRTLLVLDRAGIEHVTASPDTFADPCIKRFLLSPFTPHGVIISRKALWDVRRQLNDHALAFGCPQHPDGNHFVRVVRYEVRRMLLLRRELLVWDDFSDMAARISQQVIFGFGEYQPDFAMHLARLVAASNWGFRPGSDFSAFFGRIDEQLNRRAPTAGGHASLVCRSASWLTQNPAATDAKASSQIAFWLFVMKEAIQRHTVRVLALIASAKEDVREQLCLELERMGRPTAAGIVGLSFLEACIKESLRLWTPVPLLIRRVAVKRTELPGGVSVKKNQQILMHAGFYHRDPEVFGASADRFSPWNIYPPRENIDPPRYVFSAGRQTCAGEFLIIFLLKAVLAALLTRTDVVLKDQSVAMDPVPDEINHFGMRFWRRERGRRFCSP